MFSLSNWKLKWPFSSAKNKHFLFEDDIQISTMAIQNKVLSDILDENGEDMVTAQPEEAVSEEALHGAFSIQTFNQMPQTFYCIFSICTADFQVDAWIYNQQNHGAHV